MRRAILLLLLLGLTGCWKAIHEAAGPPVTPTAVARADGPRR